MSAKRLSDGMASKGRELLSLARSLVEDGQHGRWILPAVSLSGIALALYIMNKALNTRALNHGTKAAFDWSKEVVLVTGGSGGIGGETVKRIAAGGTTVVVLDLIPLSYPASKTLKYEGSILRT